MKIIIRGKKGDESTEMPPSAIISLILTVIFVVVVVIALFNIWFGGLTSPEQKARLAMVKIADAIPDNLKDEEFKEVEVNLPESYGIFSQPIGNGQTNLSLYKLKDGEPKNFVDYQFAKADNVFRAHSSGYACTENSTLSECKRTNLSKIYCSELEEKGNSFGIKTTYCVYTTKTHNGIYTFIIKNKCSWAHEDMRNIAEKCHLFDEIKAQPSL